MSRNIKPDTTIIETNSISFLNTALTKTGKLKPQISENDKTPSWDGSVLVYNDYNFSKENLDCIVPVQVKGKWASIIPEEDRKTFPIDVKDLLNYQKNEGVIFLLVYCNYVTFKIYYSSLLPIDLDTLLKGKRQKKTISVTLNAFPIDRENEIYSIFKNFSYHSKKQIQRNCELKELYFNGKLSTINSSFVIGNPVVPYNSKDEIIKYMFDYPTYLYLKPKFLDIDIVFGKMIMDKFIEEKPFEFFIDGELLFDKIFYEHNSNGKIIIRIGKNISFDMETKQVNFKFADTLSDRIRDFKFVKYAFLMHGDITDDTIIIEDNNITFKEFADHIDFLSDLKTVLDKMNVKKELILKDVTQKEWNKMNALVRSILYNEAIPYSLNGNDGIGTFEFGNIKLLVFCEKTTLKNRFKFFDLFKKRFGFKYQSSNMWFSPYFEILKKETLISIDNIDFDIIYNSIIEFRKSSEYDDHINLYALELISAYDITNKNEFISLADKLLDFVIDKDQSDIYKINKFQIKKE